MTTLKLNQSCVRFPFKATLVQVHVCHCLCNIHVQYSCSTLLCNISTTFLQHSVQHSFATSYYIPGQHSYNIPVQHSHATFLCNIPTTFYETFLQHSIQHFYNTVRHSYNILHNIHTTFLYNMQRNACMYTLKIILKTSRITMIITTAMMIQ